MEINFNNNFIYKFSIHIFGDKNLGQLFTLGKDAYIKFATFFEQLQDEPLDKNEEGRSSIMRFSVKNKSGKRCTAIFRHDGNGNYAIEL